MPAATLVFEIDDVLLLASVKRTASGELYLTTFHRASGKDLPRLRRRVLRDLEDDEGE